MWAKRAAKIARERAGGAVRRAAVLADTVAAAAPRAGAQVAWDVTPGKSGAELVDAALLSAGLDPASVRARAAALAVGVAVKDLPALKDEAGALLAAAVEGGA